MSPKFVKKASLPRRIKTKTDDHIMHYSLRFKDDIEPNKFQVFFYSILCHLLLSFYL